MGCYRLWVGAESGSQRVLDAMDRRTVIARITSQGLDTLVTQTGGFTRR